MITISGANGARFNGTYAITVVDANTFRYTIVDNPLVAGNRRHGHGGIVDGQHRDQRHRPRRHRREQHGHGHRHRDRQSPA